MAVDFIGYTRNRMDDEDPGPSPSNPSLGMVIEEAEAAVSLETSMEHLIHILSSSSQKDSNMTKKQTPAGHARFRRGASSSSSSSSVPQNNKSVDHTTNKGTKECDDSMSISTSMPSSSITTNTTAGGGGGGEGSVSNGIGIGKQLQQQQGSPAPAPWSAAKPPLAGTTRPRKRPNDAAIYVHHSAGHSNGHNHCHCHCKKRKHEVKRRIKVKVTSSYMEIPPDDYAWKKYGQKPIYGSPHHRGYYRCSSSRGCPARKTVERSHLDPTILVITYGGEHRH